jgi:hypothetical protein
MNAIFSKDPYEKLVSSYLGDVIRDVKKSGTFSPKGEGETFLIRSRQFFILNLGKKSFSEEKLRKVYIDYAIENMHRIFTISQGRTPFSKGISSQGKNLHCVALTQAIHRALECDFKNSIFPNPPLESIKKRVTLLFQKTYDEEMAYLTTLLLNERLNFLLNEAQSSREIPSVTDLIKEIFDDVKSRFVHD